MHITNKKNLKPDNTKNLKPLKVKTNSVSNLEFDPVELIKAGPGASLRETLEELSHGLVVQPVRAVEHHTLGVGGKIGKS